ncbi:hypothetical protein B0H19DRAFT_1062263 [Mycena capillaripes]|nr:hypothetical protein B0H19DRAFT_1062263 [Mycena capillaripes]
MREILEHTKQKKNNLTINMYARCFKALDTLDMLLSAGDTVEASLKAFKLDLLTEINVPAFRTTYTSTAAAPPPSSSTPSRSPASPAPKAAATKSWEVTVLLNKESNVLTLLLQEIKSIELAIAAVGVKKLKGGVLRGVKVLPQCQILVAVDSDRAASLLKQSAAHWVPKLAKNNTLEVLQCQIVGFGFSPSVQSTSFFCFWTFIAAI